MGGWGGEGEYTDTIPNHLPPPNPPPFFFFSPLGQSTLPTPTFSLTLRSVDSVDPHLSIHPQVSQPCPHPYISTHPQVSQPCPHTLTFLFTVRSVNFACPPAPFYSPSGQSALPTYLYISTHRQVSQTCVSTLTFLHTVRSVSPAHLTFLLTVRSVNPAHTPLHFYSSSGQSTLHVHPYISTRRQVSQLCPPLPFYSPSGQSTLPT